MFKAFMGKTARSIVKNKVLPWVTNELNKIVNCCLLL